MPVALTTSLRAAHDAASREEPVGARDSGPPAHGEEPLLPVDEATLGFVESSIDRGVGVVEEVDLRRRPRDRDLVSPRDPHVDRHAVPFAVPVVSLIDLDDDMAVHDAIEETIELASSARHMSCESVRVGHSSKCALQG